MLEDFQSLGLKLRFIYSIAGFVLGLSCIVVGVALGLSGAIGGTNVTAQVMGLSPTLTDSAPGSILVLAGTSVVWMTRRKGGTQRTSATDGAQAMVDRRN